MRTCSKCFNWAGDQSAYAAACTLGLRARPVFDQDATGCIGYIPLPDAAAHEAAHADLLALCAACTAAEIQAVLDALPMLDGRRCDHTFAGVVAVARGYRWAQGVPGAVGVYHEWEHRNIRSDGAPELRVLLGEWLQEALVAARAR